MRSASWWIGSSGVAVPARSEGVRHETLEWGGVTIAYSWCHSRRRTLGITVRPDKRVAVRVPLGTPVREMRAFVTQRAEWVLKVWNRLDAAPGRQLPGYGLGSVFLYQGQEYCLEFETGQQRSLQLRGRFLVLTAPELPPEETVRGMIDKWYRRQALEIVEERSIACHRLLQAEGIPLPQIRIRPMKTRWGSYSYRTKRINLNLNLVRAPLACLDYVIIHELCHIKVRHHGTDFWRMVARYLPDYQAARRELKQYI